MRIGKWIKKVSVIVVAMSIFNLAGCSGTNERQAKQMTDALKEKYGIEFKVSLIGNRWNQDSATLICYPKDDPELRFTTRLYKDGTIWEEYIRRAIGRQVENLVNSKFRERGIDSQVYASFSGIKPSIFGAVVPSLQDVIKNNDLKTFNGDIILPDSFRLQADAAEIISEIYQELYKEFGNTRFGVEIGFIADEEFEKASQNLRASYSSAGDGWYADYTVTSRFRLSIDENGLSETIEELKELLKGDK